MPSHKYDLIAIDLDGTLIDHHGKVHPDNIDALAECRRRGVMVSLCTGRALIETRPTMKKVGQVDPVIVAGGAIVSDAISERTLERFTMDAGLVERINAHLKTQNHASLLLKDPDAAGFDYLCITHGREPGPRSVDIASRWWFERMGVRVRYLARLEDDEHPEHTVRVGACSANVPITDLASDLHERFHAEVMLQHFNGVLMPTDRRDIGIESIHIVEVFNPKADKWQALQRLAARLGVPESRTCAIGDQTNDLSMITHAGLGIAMGNAHEKVMAASKRQTERCENAGVARALERVLSGEW